MKIVAITITLVEKQLRSKNVKREVEEEENFWTRFLRLEKYLNKLRNVDF